MSLWKHAVLFYLGGGSYMALEFLWRGRSHGSMFLLGGACFMLLGKADRLPLSFPVRGILGAAGITLLELLTGLAVNRTYRIWDYRNQPCNFCGQICLAYSLLWLPLSCAGMIVYRHCRQALESKQARL